MIPKEKAEELVDKYIEILPSRNSIMYIGDIETAQQCALIAVDEILLIQQAYEGNRDEFKTYLDYWQEVKQEINKL